MEQLNVTIKTENGVALNEELVKNYLFACKMVEEFEEAKKQMGQRITEAMGENHILSFDGDGVKITYFPESTKETFDSKAFKEDHKDLYDSYTKLSNVKPYIRIAKAKK